MVYTGFCDKQNKNYSVEFRQISVSSLEDIKPMNSSKSPPLFQQLFDVHFQHFCHGIQIS